MQDEVVRYRGVSPGTRLQDLVGHTPLLPLRPDRWDLGKARIAAKAEWFNPGGSVKDRPVLAMIQTALSAGDGEGKTLLDATSGNTGIAIAMLGASLGLPTKLVVPENVSPERKAILRSYGATLVLTDPLAGTDGAQRVAEAIYQREPETHLYLDQYNNPANCLAHYETTGPELLEQTAGKISHFVCGIGTGGSLVGTGRRLKAHDPTIQVIGVQPATPLHGIEGLKHLESSRRPGIYDPSVLDGEIFVETEAAQVMARELARREGLLVGTSSGAALWAALQVARENPTARIVTLFPDGGDRYLSEARREA